VIRRAAELHDEVVVALLYNPAKQGAFSIDERVAMVREAVADLPGVNVQAFAGRLLVDVCREVGAQSVVKGLRDGTDFAYELPMALMNRHLSGLETVFLPGDPAYAHVSSSLVREVAGLGGDITGLVTAPVQAALVSRLGPGGSGPGRHQEGH